MNRVVEKAIKKTLSSNDVGETGSHQAGMHIPKKESILSFFPKLDRFERNPRVHIDVTDETGQSWKLSFIYYNNKFFGGTRNEFRLTRLTKFISQNALSAGDEIVLEQLDDGDYRIRSIRANSEIKAPEDVLKLGSNWVSVRLKN